MSDLTIDTSAITAALTKNLEGFEPSLEASQVGHIIEVGDGIARVSGLPNAAVNEMLEFENGMIGLALNLDESSIGAVVLGEVDEIAEGQTVRSTGNILSMPVGDALLGRVVNALGTPIDGKGPLVGARTRQMEVQAPGIMGRKPVHEPMQTGIKAIDSLIPIGRGQRERHRQLHQDHPAHAGQDRVRPEPARLRQGTHRHVRDRPCHDPAALSDLRQS